MSRSLLPITAAASAFRSNPHSAVPAPAAHATWLAVASHSVRSGMSGRSLSGAWIRAKSW